MGAWQGAYLVSVLHALKYPASSVNGVLLGTFDQDGTVQVQQALPLLHSSLALAPMMDAGERWCLVLSSQKQNAVRARARLPRLSGAPVLTSID